MSPYTDKRLTGMILDAYAFSVGVPLRFSTSRSTLSKLIKPSVSPDMRPANRVRNTEPAPGGRRSGSALALLRSWCLYGCSYGKTAKTEQGQGAHRVCRGGQLQRSQGARPCFATLDQ